MRRSLYKTSATLLIASALVVSQGCGSSYDQDWFQENTVSQRQWIKVPRTGTLLSAEQIKEQLSSYDPGRLLRCAVEQNEGYKAAINVLGGVSWGYRVNILEDESKPRFERGYPRMRDEVKESASPRAEVEIEESDIVGISESDALFYSSTHGLFMVDLTGQAPVFKCATQLPGRVDKFFFHKDHLVVMVSDGTWGDQRQSGLLHFKVADRELRFVEYVELGQVSILDTRRFNDQLVIFTNLTIEAPATSTPTPAEESSGTADAAASSKEMMPDYYQRQTPHRSLRIFTIGETLEEAFQDTLIDTTQSDDYWASSELDRATPLGTQLSEATSYGSTLWASDHYFVVTQAITKTFLQSWETRHYQVCTQSHTVEIPYTYCRTIFEEQPNPNYTPPDNSGGDRSCQGTTLSDCLHEVAKASSKTIQVPVGKECEQQVRTDWFCDKYEQKSTTYPIFDRRHFSTLFIYEYTESGFIKLDSKVHEIVNEGLDQLTLDAKVDSLTTSDEAYDLLIEGELQTLHFQNGFLYVIAAGNLQVYSMGDSSMVRTSTLPLVNDTLQTALFTADKIYLSDFGYDWSHDRSTLKVVDLTNPAFPTQLSNAYELPGGHSAILPTSFGIMTIGMVQNFTEEIRWVIKLGLFSDPFAAELAYLIIGTDLIQTILGEDKSHYFDTAAGRLFLPYSGYAKEHDGQIYRVGVSHLEKGLIQSEGAVELPEAIRRVRPLPGDVSAGLLGFTESSISWLKEAQGQWQKEPVLEYFTPVALYRISDDDDWVEVLRLGNRCRLRFAKKLELNKRDLDQSSEEFACYGYGVWAYENNLIFSDASGVRFTAEGEFSQLTPAEIAVMQDQRKERPICLFSTEAVEDTTVDFDDPPSLDSMTCLSPEQYSERY